MRGAAGLCRVRARPGVGESSDGLAPRGRERKRKGGEMTGWAGGKGNGPAGGGVWAAGEEKEREREVGWAKTDREGERVFFNNEIQTIQFKFKFREFKFKLNNKQ